MSKKSPKKGETLPKAAGTPDGLDTRLPDTLAELRAARQELALYQSKCEDLQLRLESTTAELLEKVAALEDELANRPDDSVTTRQIFGPDDRKQVDSNTSPHTRALAFLEITLSDGKTKKSGTGWYAAPHLIITAGHCVFDRHVPGALGWVKSIKVYPVRNGNFQPYPAIEVTAYETTGAWIDYGDSRGDFGAIFLPQAWIPFPKPYQFRNPSDTELIGAEALIAGYPNDKVLGTLWEAKGPINYHDFYELYYQIDTMPGVSGAPLLQIEDGHTEVIGIHHWGAATGNRAVRLTDGVIAQLRLWIARSQSGAIT